MLGALAGMAGGGGGGYSNSVSDTGANTSGTTNTIGGVNIGKGAGQTISGDDAIMAYMVAGAAVFIVLLLMLQQRRR